MAQDLCHTVCTVQKVSPRPYTDDDHVGSHREWKRRNVMDQPAACIHECGSPLSRSKKRRQQIKRKDTERINGGGYLPLQVLRVSRQFYEEANYLLWSTNAFSFRDPRAFVAFFKNLTLPQQRDLQNVELYMRFERPALVEQNIYKWDLESKRYKILPKMKGVKVLNLHVGWMPRLRLREYRLLRIDRMLFFREEMAKLSALKMLKWEAATVTVNDKEGEQYRAEFSPSCVNGNVGALQGASGTYWEPFTTDQKRELADEFRVQLLAEN